MQNDNVLMFLYEKLFPATTLRPNSHSLRSLQPQIVVPSSHVSQLSNNENLAPASGRHSEIKMHGSRLELRPDQTKELNTLYPVASTFARKSFGGNTQHKYKTGGFQYFNQQNHSSKNDN